jgi:histone demethylase JARID1
MDSKKKIQTKEQMLHRIQEGISFGDGEEYTASDYLRHAHEQVTAWYDANYAETNKPMTPLNIERDYWDLIESLQKEYFVEYGNDVDTHVFGSGFPRSERGRCLGGEIDVEKVNLPEPAFGTEDYYKETYWNLNNIPLSNESVLRHVKVGINGINVPWLYFGSIFTTFCYHTEDNDFYSINYHHYGK